jgi:polyisoprenoid-binding protein YceI
MSTATAPATGTTTVWAIDPSHSSVEFSVRHMMISTSKGRFSGVSGTITLDPDNFANSHAEVTIDASTIDTRDEKRDAHLRSADFFNVEKYPNITFKSTRVVKDGDDYKVYGDLTILDVTREVELKTEFHGQNKTPWGFEVVGFSASTKINRKEFGLNWNAALETGGFLVGDEVKVHIEIEANNAQG